MENKNLEMKISDLETILTSTNLKKSSINKYLGVLRTINKLMNWNPFDVLYFTKINENYNKVKDIIKSHYKLTSTDKYREKISCLASLMSKAFPNEENKLKLLTNNAGTMLSIADTREKKNVDDWITLRNKLCDTAKENSVRGLISLIFSYGYVLRVNEIFTTSIIPTDDLSLNYLDLDSNVWYIRNGKTGFREFKVCQDFCDEIKNKCQGQTFLIEKEKNKIFSKSCRRLTYVPLKWEFPKNNLIRSSFETYNLKYNDPDQQQYYFNVLGHTSATAEVHYNITSSTESDEDTASIHSVESDDQIFFEPTNIELRVNRNLKITHLDISDLDIRQELDGTYSIFIIKASGKSISYNQIIDYEIF